PGVGLLEATNLSVGRGTDSPFEVLGAPWIDGRRLARELNDYRLAGVSFVPIEFVPEANKYAGETCRGVNIHLVDRNALDPVRMGVAVACALRKLFPSHWDTASLDRLLVNRQVCEAIVAGDSPDEILRSYEAESAGFAASRRQAFRYERPRDERREKKETKRQAPRKAALAE
ncbi:MAG: hypothetical protein AAF961_19930, partial [Planctomycetota bacterium]